MNAKQKLAEVDRLALQSRSEAPRAGLPPIVLDTVSDTDNRIVAAKLVPGAMIRLKLMLWEIQVDNDQVTVYTTRTGTSDWRSQHTFNAGPEAGRPTEYEVQIPADALIEDNPPETPTGWDVQYRVKPPIGNPWSSDRTPIIIDRRAPYQVIPGGAKSRPPIATLPTLSTGDVIDEDFIERNKTGMVVTFPVNYLNPLPDDKVFFYISSTYSLVNPDAPLFEGTFTVAANVGTFTVDIAKVQLLDPRAIYAYYVLEDGVGHRSALSAAKGLKVLFKPAPQLKKPIVPLATTDKLIDLKDCGVGVKIQLERVDNILDDDEVKITWNNQDLGTVDFGANDPFEKTVPFSDIETDYYKGGADTDTDVPVKVEATLLRGPTSISTSFLDDFYSNIYYPGPINPTDPVPPNGQLDKPHITSTTVDDVLEREDYNKPHTVTIKLPADPDKPVKTGQQVFGEYVGVRFGPEFLKDGDTEATLTLPWETIDGGGLGPDKPLQWFLSDIGGVNENPSQITKVTNNAIVVDLVPPEVEKEYEDKDPILCIDLKEPNFGLKVHIPGNPTHLKAGRNVILYAQGYRDAAMTQTAPGTDFKSPSHPIVDPEGTNGFDLTITPYDPFIRNIPVPPPDPVVPGDYLGWWKIWYTVEINSTEYPSNEFHSTISLVNGRGEYCEDAS